MKIMGIPSNVPCTIKARLPCAGARSSRATVLCGQGRGVANVRDDPGAGPRGSRGRGTAKLPRAQGRRSEGHMGTMAQWCEDPGVAKRKNEGRMDAMPL